MSDRDDPRKLEPLFSRGFGWLADIDNPRLPEATDAVCPFGHDGGEHFAFKDGDQWKFHFANGFGASVVRHGYSYGSENGLWELAVIGTDGRLAYDTPITDDVIGWLTEERVSELLADIEALPAAVKA